MNHHHNQMILNKKNQHYKQQGAVLIVLFLTMLMIVSGVLISRLNQSKDSVLQNQIKAQQHNARVLAEAKAALMGFAISYAETHVGQPAGYLICPDKDGSGSANPPCGGKGKNSIGCFPYKTLGTPKLTDYFGNELWYVVSGTYKDSPKSLTNDDDNDNKINIENGNQNMNNIIAAIIAPNIALSNQSRLSQNDCLSYRNYVESSLNIDENNTSVIWTLKNLNLTNGINDQITWITTDDYKNIKPDNQNNIYDLMLRWVVKRVQSCLVNYIKTKREYVQEYANKQAISIDAAKNIAEKYPWLSAIGSANYNYNENARFGFLANNIDDFRDETSVPPPPFYKETPPFFQTQNDIDLWQKDCFNTGGASWWVAWREKVFIAIDKNYAPNGDGVTVPELKLDDNPTKFVILVQKKKNVSDDHNLTLLKKLAGESPVIFPETFSTQEIDSLNSIACSDQSCL